MVREIMDKSKWEKIKSFNYKKYKLFLLPVVLLLLMPISFLLIREQQDIRQRASETSPTLAPLYGSTPIEDVDKYPKQPNGVQTLAWFGNTSVENFDKYKSFIAKQMNHYHFGHCAMERIREDRTSFINAVNYLKANNPSMTIGVSIFGMRTFSPCHELYYVLNDSDHLHKPDGTAFAPGSASSRLINFSNPQTRQKIVDYVKNNIINNPNIDGIFIDNYFPQREYSFPEYAQGCMEGTCNTFEFWHNNVTAMSQELKSILPTGKTLSYNGLRKEMTPLHRDDTGEINQAYIDYHTGTLSEGTWEIYNDISFFKTLLSTINSVTAQGKTVYFHVLARGLFNSQHSDQINLEMQRFFLGSYLLIQNNPYTYFGYAPGNIYNMNEGVFFYQDWNRNYGNPTENYREVGGLYVRNYENGLVVVNPTDSNVSSTLPAGDYRIWDAEIGPLVKGVQNIPPKSGIFFFKPVCIEMPAPQNIKPSGSVISGVKQLTWDVVPGAVRYLLRIDDRTNTSEPAGACQGRAGDICLALTENSYNYNFVAGHKYNWWVHAVNYCGAYGSQTNATISVSSDVISTPTVSVTATPTPTIAFTPTPTITVLTPTLTPTIAPTLSVDRTAPTVTITSPASGAILMRGTTVTFTASATDNIGVARVQFFNNGTLLNTDITSPFSFSWSIPTASGVQLKTTTLSVTAYDAAGNKTSFSRSYTIR